MATFEITQALIDALSYVITFGQHKGRAIEWLLENEPGYCNWICKQPPSNNPAFTKAKQMILIAKGEDPNKVKKDYPLGPTKPKYQTTYQPVTPVDPEPPATFVFIYMSEAWDQSSEEYGVFDFLSVNDCDLWNKLRTSYHETGVDIYLMIFRTGFGDQLLGWQRKSWLDQKNGNLGKLTKGAKDIGHVGS